MWHERPARSLWDASGTHAPRKVQRQAPAPGRRGKLQVRARMKTFRHNLRGCAGFTMLEILLAMTVLVIIMLMLTTMFDQSASTWESGIRETSRALEGRTIVNLIARDLEMAVMNADLYTNGPIAQAITPGLANSITFYRYAEPTEDSRAVKAVSYALSGTALRRTEWRIEPPYVAKQISAGDLLDNVDAFEVYAAPGGPYDDKLPEWVNIRLELTETANAASDIQVWSYGPDRNPGGENIVE